MDNYFGGAGILPDSISYICASYIHCHVGVPGCHFKNGFRKESTWRRKRSRSGISDNIRYTSCNGSHHIDCDAVWRKIYSYCDASESKGIPCTCDACACNTSCACYGCVQRLFPGTQQYESFGNIADIRAVCKGNIWSRACNPVRSKGTRIRRSGSYIRSNCRSDMRTFCNALYLLQKQENQAARA